MGFVVTMQLDSLALVGGVVFKASAVEALVSDHLGNSKKSCRAGRLRERALLSHRMVKQQRVVACES